MRAAAALAAIVVAAWFGLGVRQAASTEHAQRLLDTHLTLTAAQAARAGTLLDRAGTLNPDGRVEVLRAQLAAETGRQDRARAILGRLVRDHPDDAEAWLRLSLLTSGRAHEQARAQVLRLSPPVR